MDLFYKIKNWSLLFFIFGMLMLGLFGYGKYSYGSFGNKIVPANPIILPLAIPLLLPYLVSLVYEYFHNNKSHQKQTISNQLKVENLLQSGEVLEINFDNSVVEIYETEEAENIDLEILKENFLFPVDSFLNNKNLEIFSKVKLQYKVGRKKYFKYIQLPFSKENTMICFKMQKSTVLYYDKQNPEKSVIDLKFIEKYL